MRQSTPLGDRIRMLAAPYAATGHRERAEGLIQAADLVDAEAALLTGKAMVEVLGQMIDERLEGFVADVVAALRSEADAAPPPEGPRRKGRRAPEPPAPPPASPRAAREQERFGTLVGALTMAHGERQVLVAICQHDPTPLQRDQLQALTGYTKRTVNNYLQALAGFGYVVRSPAGALATPAGKRDVGPYEKLPTGKDLLTWWLTSSKLGEGERRVLKYVAGFYPHPVHRERIESETGYTKRTCNNYLQALRRLRLVAKAGASTTVLTEHLVDAKARGAA